MATEGKLPLLGFKAAAIKFVTLLGFSPSSAPTASPRTVDLEGSYVTTFDLQGSYVTTIDLEGSVGD